MNRTFPDRTDDGSTNRVVRGGLPRSLARPRRGSSKLRLLALLTAVAISVAACGGGGGGGSGNEAGEEEGTPEAGGKVTMALEAESVGWQPGRDSWSASGDMVMRSLYDPLMMRAADGAVKPFLAESFETSADLKEWTFKLRPGVKFHDGTELNAAVMKENFTLLKAPGARTAGSLATVSDMVVIDDLSFKYGLTVANAAFPDLLTGALGMPFSMKNYRERGENISANPVGTGPFAFVRWQRDSELLVRKNPSYWIPGLPHLDEVVFRPIPDEDARIASLISGEVQLMHTLRQESVKKAKAGARDADYSTYEFQGNSSGAQIYNTARPPLDDRRVRLALAHAINQTDFIKVLGGEGVSRPSTQLFTESSPWYSQDAAAKYPKYDVEKARGLLKSYVDDPGRSDRKPVGAPISFTYNSEPNPASIDAALLLQQFWKAIGAEVSLRQVEQATHINNAVGVAPDYLGDYDAQSWRLGSESDPDVTLYNAFRDPKGNASNVVNFSTPRLQELLSEGRSSVDVERRKKIYGEVSTILAEEVPFTLSGDQLAVVGARNNVKGIMHWTFPDRTTKGPAITSSVVTFREVWLDR